MKITANTSSLVAALKRVVPFTPSRQAPPILNCVLLRASNGLLSLRTSNLDREIELSIPVAVVESGVVAVPVRRLLAIVRELSGSSVTLSLDGDHKLLVESGISRFSLFVQPDVDFPAVVKIDGDRSLAIAQSKLKEPIANVSPSASKDETRYFLNGVLFDRSGDELALVATDGRRLAYWTVNLEGEGSDFKAIVPTATMQQVESLLSLGEKVKIDFNEKMIGFTFEVKEGDKDGLVSVVIVKSKLIEGNYPNYKAVLPNNENHSEILLNRTEFLSVVSRGKLLLTDKSYSVKLEVADDSLTISGSSSEFGTSKEALELSSEYGAAQVSLNPDFIMDGISGLSDEEIRLFIGGELSPVMVKNIDGSFTSVIMPFRLS